MERNRSQTFVCNRILPSHGTSLNTIAALVQAVFVEVPESTDKIYSVLCLFELSMVFVTQIERQSSETETLVWVTLIYWHPQSFLCSLSFSGLQSC